MDIKPTYNHIKPPAAPKPNTIEWALSRQSHAKIATAVMEYQNARTRYLEHLDRVANSRKGYVGLLKVEREVCEKYKEYARTVRESGCGTFEDQREAMDILNSASDRLQVIDSTLDGLTLEGENNG